MKKCNLCGNPILCLRHKWCSRKCKYTAENIKRRKADSFVIEDLEGEEWKTLDIYTKYSISNLGRVKKDNSYVGLNGKFVKNEKLMKPRISLGYPSVTVSNNNFKKSFLIHRLLAIYYIPNPENKPCVNHKNGIRHDHRLINLEWCTYSENTLHAFATGLKTISEELRVQNRLRIQGSKNKFSKINEEDVCVIRDLHKKKLSTKEIGTLYGITATNVNYIVSRKTWKHVK